MVNYSLISKEESFLWEVGLIFRDLRRHGCTSSKKKELDSAMISRLDHFHKPLPTKYWASLRDYKTCVKNHTDQSKISLDF